MRAQALIQYQMQLWEGGPQKWVWRGRLRRSREEGGDGAPEGWKDSAFFFCDMERSWRRPEWEVSHQFPSAEQRLAQRQCSDGNHSFFAVDLHEGNYLMSWDIKRAYRHFYLHLDIREYFLFRYENRFYSCISLQFGWGRSVIWFIKMLRTLVLYL